MQQTFVYKADLPVQEHVLSGVYWPFTVSFSLDRQLPTFASLRRTTTESSDVRRRCVTRESGSRRPVTRRWLVTWRVTRGCTYVSSRHVGLVALSDLGSPTSAHHILLQYRFIKVSQGDITSAQLKRNYNMFVFERDTCESVFMTMLYITFYSTWKGYASIQCVIYLYV